MKERFIIWFYNHFDQMLSVNVNNIDNKIYQTLNRLFN